MRQLLASLIALHGLIHLLGFAKAFRPARLPQMTSGVPRPAGLLWLACAGLLLGAAGLFLARQPAWAWCAAAGLVLSQALVLSLWREARFGTLANLVLLLPVLAGLLETLPSSYGSRLRAAAQQGLARRAETPLVSEADLAHLPPPVRSYLRACGVVGKPRVRAIRVVFRGQFRNGHGAPWMPFRSEQYNFFDQPERIFLMDASMRGLPVQGFHDFRGEGARMQIKVASLVQVVDARGPKMDQGETVTLFNDLCLLAPAELVDRRIRWEEAGPRAAKAWFTRRGVTIQALLTFNESGELVDFLSRDRFLSADGKTYASHPWSTPVGSYRNEGGRRVPAYGEAIWRLPEGDFCYGRFNLVSIEYDPPGEP